MATGPSFIYSFCKVHLKKVSAVSRVPRHFWLPKIHLADALRHRVSGCLKFTWRGKKVDVFFKGKCFGCGRDCAAFGLEKNDASPTACYHLATQPAWRAKAAMRPKGVFRWRKLYLAYPLSAPDNIPCFSCRLR
jgi:hypothetical protein